MNKTQVKWGYCTSIPADYKDWFVCSDATNIWGRNWGIDYLNGKGWVTWGMCDTWTPFAVDARPSSSTEQTSASYFPITSNPVNPGPLSAGVWQRCPSHPRPVQGNASSSFTLDSLTSRKGVHLESSKWVSEIFQKTKRFVWHCHSSGRCPSKTEITAQIICRHDWYCAPPSPQWCECIFWWMFWWLRTLGGGFSHNVLCLTFQNCFQ